jgi:periplasmic protein TonB
LAAARQPVRRLERRRGGAPPGDLFATLPVSRPARGRSVGLAASLAGHAALALVALLALAVWPVSLPDEHVDYARVLLYDPPPPPPPPPLPLGRGSVDRAASRPARPLDTPGPDALVAPVLEPAPAADEPAAPSPELAPGGSPTGSESGSPEGMEGGVEGGIVGGVPGGALGGVLGGVLGGTGHGVVKDYDRPPRAIRLTRPPYPHEAFAKKVEGTVEVEIVIDARGSVVAARVVRSIPLLDTAALATVREWRFVPALKHGQPVASIAFAPITFRIY